MSVRRVCINPGTLGQGGIGNNSIQLAEALITKGLEVDLFLTHASGGRISSVPDKVNIYEGGGRALTSFPHLVQYLRSCEPDLLISARDHINVLSVVACKMARVQTKVACTFRTHISVDTHFKSWRGRFYNSLARYVVKRADHLVGVSKGVSSDVEEWLGESKGKVKTIYNPAWNERLADQVGQPVAHSWLQHDTHGPVLISVGRLTKQKDFPTLLKAFAGVRKFMDARLIILGEGEERQSLKSLANSLDLSEHVSMPGHVSNPVSHMARADLFVLSSAWEGFGNVIVEALGVGTPVVATDCPSGPAEILEEGRYGRLIPVGDWRKLAHAITEVLQQPVDSKLLQSRAAAFTAEHCASQYMRLM